MKKEDIPDDCWPLPICYKCGKEIMPDAEDPQMEMPVEREEKGTVVNFENVFIICSEKCTETGKPPKEQEWVRKDGTHFFGDGL